MKIALISPRGALYKHTGGIWKKSLRYAPLTLTTLASLVPAELNAEVMLVDEGVTDVDLHLDADLIGISAITGSALRAYELADHYRRRGLPVILGGVHPTLMPDEAAVHADTVVVGYAEQTFPQLLRDFSAGHLQARYVQSPDLSLANLPHPRRDLLNPHDYTTIHTSEATRGCIHQCDFCVVPSAWGRPRHKPVAEVIDDIRQMRAKKLIFLDLNLIANVAYAKELFAALIPLRVTWGGLATTLIAGDDELLDLAVRSGCRGLLIGFETLAEEALQSVRKGFNRHHEYRIVIDKLHAHKIALMGTFVFGFDHDTKETFDQVADFVLDSHIDLPRFAILTPFPGTPLYRKLVAEDRILTQNWSLYDGQHVVFQPYQMSPEELWRGTEAVWKRVYRYRSISRRLAGARVQLPLVIPANIGYRFYAYRLHQFYTCDWRN